MIWQNLMDKGNANMANKRKSVSETVVEAPAEQTTQRVAYRAGISGKRNRLTVRGKDPDFVYRFVNDVDDNVLAKQERGYEHVTHKVVVGDKRVATPQVGDGSVTQQNVGGGTKAYLMRIRKDWYLEDKKAKDQEVNDIEAAFMGKSAGDYGTVKMEHKTDGQAPKTDDYELAKS
jgi:hypothetical protein